MGLLLPTNARVVLPTYVPLVAARYVEVVQWVESLRCYRIGSCATGGLFDQPRGFLFALWDRQNQRASVSLTSAIAQVKAVSTTVMKRYAFGAEPIQSFVLMFNSGTDHEHVFNSTVCRCFHPKSKRAQPRLRRVPRVVHHALYSGMEHSCRECMARKELRGCRRKNFRKTVMQEQRLRSLDPSHSCCRCRGFMWQEVRVCANSCRRMIMGSDS